MEPDLLDLYGRTSQWTAEKVKGAASKLDAETPCDEWAVRDVLNHVIDTQHYFAGMARGEDAAPPSSDPPDLIGSDPIGAFEQACTATKKAFAEPGVIQKTGPALGIAFSDQLLHGWDLAKATGQDTTMPADIADAAFTMIHGRFTDDQRKGVFKPEIDAPPGAPAQTRLLAYTGRSPS